MMLRPANGQDLQDVLDLLTLAGLPHDGVAEWLPRFVVAIDPAQGGGPAGRLVGVAGFELYGHQAVLRSVAVHPDQQSGGLGSRLTEWVLRSATELGVVEIYLLTTTAPDFFPRYGFQPIDRRAVEGQVLQSVEFRGACPASAIVMVRREESSGREP